MLPFYIIFPLVGMALKIILDDSIEPKYVAYLFLERHSNAFILGFATVGLMSALMSSGDSFLNLIAISAPAKTKPLPFCAGNWGWCILTRPDRSRPPL